MSVSRGEIRHVGPCWPGLCAKTPATLGIYMGQVGGRSFGVVQFSPRETLPVSRVFPVCFSWGTVSRGKRSAPPRDSFSQIWHTEHSKICTRLDQRTSPVCFLRCQWARCVWCVDEMGKNVEKGRKVEENVGKSSGHRGKKGKGGGFGAYRAFLYGGAF